MSEWRRALNKVKTDLKIPAQNKDDSFEGLDELDDGEMEGSRNITSAMAYKSKAAVEHETNIREHQTAVTKALQKRVEQGDVACAKAVLDIQAAYLKKGVFNSGRANEVLFKKQENLLNVESVPVEAPQVVEEQKVPEVEEVKVVEAEEP